VLSTSAAVLRHELQPRLDAGALPARVGELASGSPAALERLRAAATAFHAVAVAPYWTEIVAAVHADRAARGSTIVGHGIEQVLHTLSPHLRWDASTLSYACAIGADLDVEPNGRGVTLLPSYLLEQPVYADIGDEPLMISYPIERNSQDLTGRKPLADLRPSFSLPIRLARLRWSGFWASLTAAVLLLSWLLGTVCS
jgi:hypothetical protein